MESFNKPKQLDMFPARDTGGEGGGGEGGRQAPSASSAPLRRIVQPRGQTPPQMGGLTRKTSSMRIAAVIYNLLEQMLSKEPFVSDPEVQRLREQLKPLLEAAARG